MINSGLGTFVNARSYVIDNSCYSVVWSHSSLEKLHRLALIPNPNLHLVTRSLSLLQQHKIS